MSDFSWILLERKKSTQANKNLFWVCSGSYQTLVMEQKTNLLDRNRLTCSTLSWLMPGDRSVQFMAFKVDKISLFSLQMLCFPFSSKKNETGRMQLQQHRVGNKKNGEVFVKEIRQSLEEIDDGGSDNLKHYHTRTHKFAFLSLSGLCIDFHSFL